MQMGLSSWRITDWHTVFSFQVVDVPCHAASEITKPRPTAFGVAKPHFTTPPNFGVEYVKCIDSESMLKYPILSYYIPLYQMTLENSDVRSTTPENDRQEISLNRENNLLPSLSRYILI